MNRVEFMAELERLLADLPEDERQAAVQYYADYFADAGAENEAEVIRELGSPEFLDYRSFEKLAAASRTRREDFAEGETIFLAPGTVALLCFRHGQ